MSGRVEHLYEILFFFAFVVPLFVKVFPGLFATIHKKTQSRKEIAQSILDEIKSLEVSKANLTALLESERSVRSSIPHYLSEFETSIKVEISQRKDLILQDFTRKLDLERTNATKLAEIEIFKESFREFRTVFAAAHKKHSNLDGLLRELFKEVEKHKEYL